MKKRLSGLVFCMILSVLMSCAGKSTYTLNFSADQQINEDVLLPVDVIVAKEPLMNKIIKIGPEDWFGHNSREVLVDNELYPFAISGGDERKKEVVVEKDISRIIIYADYENSDNRDDQQVIINCSDSKRNYRIRIKKNNLEIEK